MAFSSPQQRIVHFVQSQTTPEYGKIVDPANIDDGPLPTLIFDNGGQSNSQTPSTRTTEQSSEYKANVIINPALHPSNASSRDYPAFYDDTEQAYLYDTPIGQQEHHNNHHHHHHSHHLGHQTPMTSSLNNGPPTVYEAEEYDDETVPEHIDEGHYDDYYFDGQTHQHFQDEFDDESIHNSVTSLDRGRQELMEDMMSDAKTYGLTIGPYFEYRFMQQQQHQQQLQLQQQQQQQQQQFAITPNSVNNGIGIYHEPVYGNPFSYNLHTILEESENEMSPLSSLDSMHHQRFHTVKREQQHQQSPHIKENCSEISFSSSSEDEEDASTAEIEENYIRNSDRGTGNDMYGRDARTARHNSSTAAASTTIDSDFGGEESDSNDEFGNTIDAQRAKKNGSRLEEYFINDLLDHPYQQGVSEQLHHQNVNRMSMDGSSAQIAHESLNRAKMQSISERPHDSHHQRPHHHQQQQKQQQNRASLKLAKQSPRKNNSVTTVQNNSTNVMRLKVHEIAGRSQMRNVIEMLLKLPQKESHERCLDCILLFNSEFRVDWLRIVRTVLTSTDFDNNCVTTVLLYQILCSRSAGIENECRHYLAEYYTKSILIHAQRDRQFLQANDAKPIAHDVDIGRLQVRPEVECTQKSFPNTASMYSPEKGQHDQPPKPPKRLKVTISEGRLKSTVAAAASAAAAATMPGTIFGSRPRDLPGIHRTVLTINANHQRNHGNKYGNPSITKPNENGQHSVADDDDHDDDDVFNVDKSPGRFRLQANPLNRSFLLKTRPDAVNDEQRTDIAMMHPPIKHPSASSAIDDASATLRTSKSMRAPKHDNSHGPWNTLIKAVSFGKAGKRPSAGRQIERPPRTSRSVERTTNCGVNKTQPTNTKTNSKSPKSALFHSEPNLHRRQGRTLPNESSPNNGRPLEPNNGRDGDDGGEKCKSTSHLKTVTTSSTDLLNGHEDSENRNLKCNNVPIESFTTSHHHQQCSQPDMIFKPFDTAAGTVTMQNESHQRTRKSSGSLSSLPSSELSEQFPGECWLSITMNPRNNSLDLDVHRCFYRPDTVVGKIGTAFGSINLYIKGYLLPDPAKTSKRKTRTVKGQLSNNSTPNTTTPNARLMVANFNETLRFNGIAGKRLWISLWSADRFGRNTALGELLIDPTEDSRIVRDVQRYLFTAPNRAVESDYATIGPKGISDKSGISALVEHCCTGSIFLATQFNSEHPFDQSCEGTLQILLKEGQNLAVSGTNGLGSIMCKISLVGEKKKNKIRVPLRAPLECLVNPRWNTTVEFPEILLRELSDKTLEISLWFQTDIVANRKNHFIGAVRLSTNDKVSTPSEYNLWHQMLTRPNLWAYGELALHNV